MQYFTIQAKNDWEALEKMKMQYGSSARVLSRKNIRLGGFLGLFKQDGVELTGYLANNPLTNRNTKSTSQTSLKEEKDKILQNVKNDKVMQLILKEVQSLKENMQKEKIAGGESNTTIDKIKELLCYNDFNEEYIQLIVQKIRAKFSLDDLDRYAAVQRSVIDWIGESISIFPSNANGQLKPKVIVIIGPTGVGKTTTVAKLAAIYGLDHEKNPSLQVRMVTIDNYKIAAKKQIETYAEIMQLPFSFTETKEELNKIINMYYDKSILLIDTIGKSPNDYDRLQEMREILSVCNHKSETHLAISATTKGSDMEEVLHQFEPFKYNAVIVTKMDETSKIGNVISVLNKYNKKISYITDGQMVPQDIEEATIARFLMHLEGFRLDREWIENKFGQKNVDTQNRME
jgi:flagellar biosynthesis protein FlhF